MLRALFISVGLFITLCGGVLLFVDRLVLNSMVTEATSGPVAAARDHWAVNHMLVHRTSTNGAIVQEELDPPDWMAYAVLSVGSVQMLYAVALPRSSKK
ncbi:hypothetical protein [Calycomorphotria hydatis]|uniref:Uncharacterized protein n=1 Tax=Calycomorphotria hydatis TaxID=2528027 RepID=A0A517T5X7_9PLAN|nr:hypothetical protein [Calycomorphotria hydatis]QDT63770.1 hypothetical protein V22_09950 [Calycomorphotria hydatis]